MVEAAMVLPILILLVLSMMLVMIYFYQVHHGQITLHQNLLIQSLESDAVFQIEKEVQHNQTRLDGMVHGLLKKERVHRVYYIKPARWILLGEMAGMEYE